MTGFQADAERLRAKAGEFDGFADRARRIAADLEWALEATGEAWGTDTPGQSFAASHAAPAAETRALVRGLSARLAEWGTKFSAAAGDYTGADTAAAEELNG
ncbi:hypothetical protein [Amycolatopsis albispora]|uniref:PE domain-containing protein n=1 Tax=Amycolatopsis albispora TaxID=1804986 RepID=A0A344LG79_9PSEU|nr:hypothetical protein [Amycolatopsis albispora]AXB47053.1 hypothetical protein A4R43_35235 [Amycolatopsis albispora]